MRTSERSLLTLLALACVALASATRALAQGDTRRAPAPAVAPARLNVRGAVRENETLSPVEGATVRLLDGRDSMVAGMSTLRNGQYLLSGVRPGRYTLRVSFMGYKEQALSLTLPDKGGNFRVGDVMLREEAFLMKEAVVEGQMPEMTVADDTIVYNADAFKLTDGAAVEELIKKLPGVEEDENGNYTWNGKPVSQLLVDGKRFFGGNMGITLKNLPADIVDKVKAYDRQSDRARLTGIDDGEERTVLDLTIKKDKKRGWFGNAEAGYGTRDRYTGRAMVNRFKGEQKFSAVGSANNTRSGGMADRQSGGLTLNYEKPRRLELNGTLNGDFSQSRSERRTSSQSFENKRAAFSNSHRAGSGDDKGLNANLRLEWKPDSMTNIELRPEFSYSDSRSRQQSESAAFRSDPYARDGVTDPLAQLDMIPRPERVNHRLNASGSDGDNKSGSASAQYNRRLGKKGRNVTVSANGGFGDSQSESRSFSSTDYYQILAMDGGDSTYSKTQYNDSRSKNRRWGARLSYSEPIADNTYLQLSYGYTRRFTDRRRDVSSVFDPLNGRLGIGAGNYGDFRHAASPDPEQCNYTTNTYQNHHINLQLRVNRARFKLTAGGSLQPQTSAVDYNKGGKHFNVSRAVTNASPALNFRYRFSRREQLDIRYNGSTGQPSITDLIPDTLSNADPLNIRLGNPGLKPSFTQTASADYRRGVPQKQRSLSANIQFSATRNSVSSRTEYDDETGGRVTRPENVNGNWNGSASLHFNTALKDRRFHLDTHTQGGMTNAVGYVYQSKTRETVKNRTRGARLGESLRLTFRNDWLEAGLGGGVNYNHSRSTNTTASNLDTYRFHYGGNIVARAPWGTTLSLDLSQNSRRGFSDASMNTDELLLGFTVSQRLLPKGALTLSLRAADALNQREEVSRSVSATARTDTRSENVHSYFLLTANLRLGKFGGKRGGASGRGGAEDRATRRGGGGDTSGDFPEPVGGRLEDSGM